MSSITAYNLQIANCGAAYIKGAIITCTSGADGKTQAIIHLVEDANAGSFKYPGDNAPVSFNLSGISFNGIASSYKRYNAASEAIAIYELIATGADNVSSSDKIFDNVSTPFNVNLFINENGTVEGVLNPNGINFGTAKFEAFNFWDTPPSNYNTSISWNSYSGLSSCSLSISNLVYKSNTFIGSSPSPTYSLQFDKTVSTPTIVIYPKTSSPAVLPNPSAGGTTTTSTSGTGSSAVTTTTSLNAFGAGTIVTVGPNTQNLPNGTTTTTSTSGGLTTTTSFQVNGNRVTTTKTLTFTPSRRTDSLSVKRRAMMGIPENFQGVIDPTVAFPSAGISEKVENLESGRFYNLRAAPTSFDLDPYFYFMENGKYKNDFQLVAKDGYSDSKYTDVKKDPYQNSVRSMGFRGPVVLSGWGYDICGLPVPNGVGEVVQTGTAIDPKTNKSSPVYGPDPSGQTKFNPKTPMRRNLWKTGPVDLRWHETRHTWVGGHDVLEGTLIQDLPAGPSGFAKMRIDRGLSYRTNETVTVLNKDPSLTASSGAFCVAMEINYTWRPIYVGC